MKRGLTLIAALVLCLPSSAPAAEKEKPKPEPGAGELKTLAEKFSYALGLDVGTSLKKARVEIDIPALMRGVQDALKGKAPLLTREQMAEVFKQMQDEQMRKHKELAEKNKTEGEAFLAKNKKKKGVVTTASGLQYVVLQQGDGPMPKATDRVRVHYRGTLIDGSEFDSSYKRGRPEIMPVAGRMLAGWTEALQLMKVGSIYRFFVPSALAYGEGGAGQEIGPSVVLIFDIRLLKIEKE